MVVEEPVVGSFVSPLPINVSGRFLCRIRFRLELLGAVRISCHGGTDRSG